MSTGDEKFGTGGPEARMPALSECNFMATPPVIAYIGQEATLLTRADLPRSWLPPAHEVIPHVEVVTATESTPVYDPVFLNMNDAREIREDVASCRRVPKKRPIPQKNDNTETKSRAGRKRSRPLSKNSLKKTTESAPEPEFSQPRTDSVSWPLPTPLLLHMPSPAPSSIISGTSYTRIESPGQCRLPSPLVTPSI